MVPDETVESGDWRNVVALVSMLILLLGGGALVSALVRPADGDPVQIAFAGLVFGGTVLGAQAVRWVCGEG